ncbi:MAG: DUF134 domain-containing protein [Candidatus Limivicinus sp.]|jgi:predicted DNA-binding protein (UPF0251 family)
MPRPRIRRRVCGMPATDEFTPVGGKAESSEPVVLNVDEYETVRLIDHEGMTQEECAEYMQVARTTVQHIYISARKKLSEMLVDGRPLVIRGGDYCLCDGNNRCCGQNCRCRRGRGFHGGRG